jgi:hypothetical protein
MESILPDIPVDFASVATSGMATVAQIVTAIAGIIVVVSLVRSGLQYLTHAFNGVDEMNDHQFIKYIEKKYNDQMPIYDEKYIMDKMTGKELRRFDNIYF